MKRAKKIKVGIIGGRGKTGRWFKNFLMKEGNFKVIVSGRHTKITNIELVEQCDAVVFSVPIGVTVDVIEEVLPYTRQDQILMDLTSIKTDTMRSMMKSQCEVLGIHPMFSPDVGSVKGQTVILFKSRPRKYTKIFEGLFRKAGARIKTAMPEEHDRIMAIIQGLTHFNAIVLAHTLRKLEIDIKESLSYTSPVYKIWMDMVGRLMAQNPRLYAEIEILNPHVLKPVKGLVESAKELLSHVEKKDVEGFIKYFVKGSEHMGNFRKIAMKESNYLIRKMSEKKREVMQ
jgi:prephenate dehydrogenase